jgi:hypothetical protein
MHYIIIAMIIIGGIFGFGYMANKPEDTAAIAEIAAANSRATENKIEALENKLSGEIALSEARIQSELEKNRLLSKHNTDRVIFAVSLIAIMACAFVVFVMSVFWIFSIIQANRRQAEYFRLAGTNFMQLGQNPNTLVRELPQSAGVIVPKERS